MWTAYPLILLVGIATAVQPGMNAALARGLGQPFAGGIAVGLTTATTVLLIGLVSGRLSWPGSEQIAAVPWWGWLGGALGGGIVAAQLTLAQGVGAATFLGLTVTAGVIASIVLDHFGWIGFEPHAAGPLRLLGGALMIGGVLLVARS